MFLLESAIAKLFFIPLRKFGEVSISSEYLKYIALRVMELDLLVKIIEKKHCAPFAKMTVRVTVGRALMDRTLFPRQRVIHTLGLSFSICYD